jgi:hypothetical protein
VPQSSTEILSEMEPVGDHKISIWMVTTAIRVLILFDGSDSTPDP